MFSDLCSPLSPSHVPLPCCADACPSAISSVHFSHQYALNACEVTGSSFRCLGEALKSQKQEQSNHTHTPDGTVAVWAWRYSKFKQASCVSTRSLPSACPSNPHMAGSTSFCLQPEVLSLERAFPSHFHHLLLFSKQISLSVKNWQGEGCFFIGFPPTRLLIPWEQRHYSLLNPPFLEWYSSCMFSINIWQIINSGEAAAARKCLGCCWGWRHTPRAGSCKKFCSQNGLL